MATKINNIEDDVTREYLRNFSKSIFKLDLQTNLFSMITFPNLPAKFDMLMSDIEYPDKSKKNPNGTLFMRPRDIDRTSADDIGLQLFGTERFTDDMQTMLKMTMNPNSHTPGLTTHNDESFNIYDKLSAMLFEDTINGRGKEIAVPDNKSRNERMEEANMDIVKAITTYVSKSVSVITPLLQMVAGQSSSSTIGEVKKAIEAANSTNHKNVMDWLESQDSVMKARKDIENREEIQKLRETGSSKENAEAIFACVAISDIPGNNIAAYINTVQKEIGKIEDKDDLDKFVRKICYDFNKWKDFEAEWRRKGKKAFKINLNELNLVENGSAENESLSTPLSSHLNEASSGGDDSMINYDEMHLSMFNTLSGAISKAIGSRADWVCIKDVANNMKVLKDRADKEIEAKIKIVCKTDGQKSVLHHPFKAEGLLTMWSRYSAELQSRIENRIAQLTGSSGGVESGSANMVEDFLRVTYPQIISVLLTYRCVFSYLAEMYKRDYVPEYTLEDIGEITSASDNEMNSMINGIVIQFDVMNENENAASA